jgi:hypothetical protein
VTTERRHGGGSSVWEQLAVWSRARHHEFSSVSSSLFFFSVWIGLKQLGEFGHDWSCFMVITGRDEGD